MKLKEVYDQGIDVCQNVSKWNKKNLCTQKAAKNLEQKFIFQLGTLSPQGINERLSFH